MAKALNDYRELRTGSITILDATLKDDTKIYEVEWCLGMTMK